MIGLDSIAIVAVDAVAIEIENRGTISRSILFDYRNRFEIGSQSVSKLSVRAARWVLAGSNSKSETLPQ